MLSSKSRFFIILGVAVVSGIAGCVDIHDTKVQVQAPGQTDPYARNVLDKCTPVIYPHRLIIAQTGSTSPLAQAGPQMVYNQQEFEKYWGYVTADENDKVSMSSLSQRPLVNWDQQMVYFLVIATGNSCEKTKPMGDEMITDCYSVIIQLYRYLEGTNCQPPGSFSVFIYFFPKTALPVTGTWFFPTPIPTSTPKPTMTPTSTPTLVPESEDE